MTDPFPSHTPSQPTPERCKAELISAGSIVRDGRLTIEIRHIIAARALGTRLSINQQLNPHNTQTHNPEYPSSGTVIPGSTHIVNLNHPHSHTSAPPLNAIPLHTPHRRNEGETPYQPFRSTPSSSPESSRHPTPTSSSHYSADVTPHANRSSTSVFTSPSEPQNQSKPVDSTPSRHETQPKESTHTSPALASSTVSSSPQITGEETKAPPATSQSAQVQSSDIQSTTHTNDSIEPKAPIHTKASQDAAVLLHIHESIYALAPSDLPRDLAAPPEIRSVQPSIQDTYAVVGPQTPKDIQEVEGPTPIENLPTEMSAETTIAISPQNTSSEVVQKEDTGNHSESPATTLKYYDQANAYTVSAEQVLDHTDSSVSPKEERRDGARIVESPYESAIQYREDALNQQEIRIERLRDIQQISAAESDVSKQSSGRSVEDNTHVTPHSGAPSVSQMERIRDRIHDRLSEIQERVIPVAEKTRDLAHNPQSIDSYIQGRNSLTRPRPVRTGELRGLATERAERAQENQQRPMRHEMPLSRPGISTIPDRLNHLRASQSFLTTTTRNVDTSLLTRTSHTPQTFSNLLDLLKRFSERSTNFSLLNKMDTSLEKACLTIATGAALGVLGASLVYRATNLAILHILRALRERDDKAHEIDIEHEQTDIENSLEVTLSECTATELSTIGERGFVVDLAGIVVMSGNDQPLADVRVICSEFGECYTDSGGRFIFTQIPLGTPYTVSISSPVHAIRPLVVTGICGELEFLRIRVLPL